MSDPQVSIIIPVFNRADLVVETLESISKQTYSNWECLITDDGSTDDTVAIIQRYMQQDPRVKLFIRPSDRTKGANTCRNIGLEQSQGDCVIFFDSDDLMTPNHVEYKVNQLVSSQKDFIITRTSFFGDNYTQTELPYDFRDSDITVANFIQKKIKWLTPDTVIRGSIARKIRFNEKLRSGQEFNFYIKLLLQTERGKLCEEVVTLRRMHEGSIRAAIDDQELKIMKGMYQSHWITYGDVRSYAPVYVRKALLSSCVDVVYNFFNRFKEEYRTLHRALRLEMGLKLSLTFRVAARLKSSTNNRMRNWSYRCYQSVLNSLKT